ncbi:hypothetical protein BHE74_00029834 [Ensete ventricosum]|nr:hypothetical protein BHE74_00029834 [Ensete ventricosum]
MSPRLAQGLWFTARRVIGTLEVDDEDIVMYRYEGVLKCRRSAARQSDNNGATIDQWLDGSRTMADQEGIDGRREGMACRGEEQGESYTKQRMGAKICKGGLLFLELQGRLESYSTAVLLRG